jgi:hypothetical protein
MVADPEVTLVPTTPLASVVAHEIRRGLGKFKPAVPAEPVNLLKSGVVSMGRRNTQLRPTFIENKS